MVDGTTVWMVRLDRGRAEDDFRGTLTLESDAVIFTEARSGIEHRFPLRTMRKPRRVRGSPILMVLNDEGAELRRTAFYFSQPPPLHPPEPGSLPAGGLGERPMGAFGAFRRSSKRRHLRGNLGYLATANASHRADIQAWVEEIGGRIGPG